MSSEHLKKIAKTPLAYNRSMVSTKHNLGKTFYTQHKRNNFTNKEDIGMFLIDLH